MLQQNRCTTDHPPPRALALAAPPTTLAAYVAHWLERRRHALKPRTVATYDDVLRLHVLRHVGELELVDLTRGIVVQLLDLLAAKKRPRTVRLTYTALHCVLADAVEAGVLVTNPAARLAKRYPLPKDRAPCYSRPQVLAFLREAVLFDAEWAAFFAVIFGAGLRVGEARALQRDDVNLERLEIRVERQLCRGFGRTAPTKSGRPRVVPVMQSLVPILTELVAARARHLFPAASAANGYQLARRAFRAIAARAGLPVYSPKSLRHAFGSTLAEVGVDLRAIQKAMGHADLRTTMIYADHYPVPRSPQLDEL